MLKLRVYPDPVLRETTKDIEVFDDEFKKFLEDMKEMMIEYDGVGLAAPQIGLSLKVAVILHEEKFYALINPVILEADGVQTAQEGCLSFPGIFEDITRADRVKIKAVDENGEPYIMEAEGFLARVFSHEIDHLYGKLMIDHLSPMKRAMVKKKLLKAARKK